MSDPSWAPDPTERHQYRWWDGRQWTHQVADDGVGGNDPVTGLEACLPPDMRRDMPDGMPVKLANGDTVHLASRPLRLGGALIDNLIGAIPLVALAWLVWSLIVWKDGLTPAKQLLKMRVMRFDGTGHATWGLMALRQLVYPVVCYFGAAIAGAVAGAFIGGTSGATVGVVLAILAVTVVNGVSVLSSDLNQSLFDKMCRTVVCKE